MSKKNTGGEVVAGIISMFNSHLDYKKEILSHKCTIEVERTKRQVSDDNTQTHLADIKFRRDVILQALKDDFKMNQLKIDQSFKVIDLALESGNIEMLGIGLTAMVKVAETSNIVSLADLSKKIEDKNNIIDI